MFFGLVLLVYTAATIFPKGPLWGFHFAGYLSEWMRWGILILAWAVFLGDMATGYVQRLGNRLVSMPPRVGSAMIYAAVPVAGVLFYFMPIHGTVYGDARNMELWYGNNDVFDPDWLLRCLKPQLFESKEVLTVGVHRTLAHFAGVSIQQAYRVGSALSGALFLLIALVFLRRTLDLRDALPAAVTAVLFLGGNQLFFGHFENYPFAVMLGLLFLTAFVRLFEGKQSVWVVLLLWIVAVRAHAIYISFAPAVMFGMLWKLHLQVPGLKRWLNWRAAAGFLVIPGVAAGIAAYFWLFGSHDEAYSAPGRQIEASFLPLVQPEPPLRDYTLFSPKHLADLINVFPQIGSPLLFVVFAFLLTRGRQVRWSDPKVMFASLALLFPLLFFLALNPALSMPRDWDLYGLLAAPIVVWCVVVLSHGKDSGPMRSLWALALCAGLFTSAGYWVNSRPQYISHRLEDIGEHVYRTYYSGSAYMIQSGQKLEADLDKQIERREATLARLKPWDGVDDFEYASLLASAGAVYSRSGDNIAAAEKFAQAVRATRHMPLLQLELSRLYLHEGLPERSLQNTLSYLKHHPASVAVMQLGAEAALAAGDAEYCTRFVTQGLVHAPGDSVLLFYKKKAAARGLLLD